MSFNVICIDASGHNSGLVKDAVYTVLEVTEKNNYVLAETIPPKPFTSFEAYRFKVVVEEPAIEEVDKCVYTS
jgi:hypothetical protein